MSSPIVRGIAAVIIVLFAGLAIAAAYSAHRLRSLHLPIPSFAVLLSILLPLLESLASIRILLASSTPDKTQAIDAAFLFAIFEGVLIALAASENSPGVLTCRLEASWASWFQTKNVEKVTSIQSQLQCCGFRTDKDRAFPFPDKTHGSDACVLAYGRTQPCLPGLTKEAKRSLMLYVGIGVVGLVVKAIVIFIIRMRGSTDNKGPFKRLFRSHSGLDPERRHLLGIDGHARGALEEGLEDEEAHREEE